MKKITQSLSAKFGISLIILVLAVMGICFGTRSTDAQNDLPKIGIGRDYDGGYYSRRKLIVMGTHEEPSIKVASFTQQKITAEAKIDIYKINKDQLLDFLTYTSDKDVRFKSKLPDVSKLTKAATVSAKIDDKTLLPLDGEGIWLLKAYTGDTETYSALIRTKVGTVAKEGNGEIILWNQNIITGKKINGGSVQIYKLEDKPTYITESAIDQDGIAKTSELKRADVAFVETKEGSALVILNLPADYYYYANFENPPRRGRYMLFTDRPLYTPGDTLHFKAILRDDDDAQYTIPSGLATVKITRDYDTQHPIFEKKYTISANGTIAGDIPLDKNSRTGNYQIFVDLGTEDREWYLRTTSEFNIEYYEKPQYYMEASSPTDILVKGDDLQISIDGKYFFGQPISGGEVSYSIDYAVDYYLSEETLEYYSKHGYDLGWYYKDRNLSSGKLNLDKKGKGKIELSTKNLPDKSYSIVTVSAKYMDSSGVPAKATKNILVRPSEYSIRATDYEYLATANSKIEIPIELKSYKGAPIAGIEIPVSVIRHSWEKNDQNYFTDKEDNVANFKVRTDYAGKATITYTPTQQGSYNLLLSVKDPSNNFYERKMYFWVTGENLPYYSERGQDLSIKIQNKSFDPGEIVPVYISSREPNRDVLLTVERDRVRRYIVASVSGISSTAYIPTYASDIPNVFVEATTFTASKGIFNVDSEEITLNKDSKQINVSLESSSPSYSPGETVQMKLKTTASDGRPVSAEVAVWTVDKSLFELMSNDRQKIMDVFWYKRYNSTNQRQSFEGIFSGGAEKGCFTGDTKVLTPSGTKSIEDIKVGDTVLTKANETSPALEKAKVTKVHKVNVPGYLILNGEIKVTAEHRMWVNSGWKNAGDIQIGDKLLNSKNQSVEVQSIEWQQKKTDVYNLTIDKKSTYFAGDVYVHNDKGGGGGIRDNFTDVAYWNPYVITDANGEATVRFTIPDNLTTWITQAVAITTDTKVGESSQEILVSKPVIIRPVLPNILRIGDELSISTIAHNFTGEDRQFVNSIEMSNVQIEGSTTRSLLIGDSQLEEIFWNIKPTKEGVATLKTSLTSNTYPEGDTVSIKVPVKEFGFFENDSFVGKGKSEFKLRVYPDTKPSSSKAMLYVSGSLFGTLPPAIEYLLQYPYGCVEQTTSRFIPAVLFAENRSILQNKIQDKDLPDIMKKGVERLYTLENRFGGWGWWYGNTNPALTAYVIEYLKRSEAVGTNVPQEIYDTTRTGFENTLSNISSPSERIPYIYSLSLLGSPKGKIEITDFGTSTPDLVALGLLSNIRNGYTNKKTNGYDLLLTMATKEGDQTYWGSGDWWFYGSREASTALALRALLKAGAPESDVAGAANFLSNSRRGAYWQNTFATAQTIDALLEYTKKYERNQNNSYKVYIDDKLVTAKTLNGIFDSHTISIDPKEIKDGGVIRVEPEATNLYTTLTLDQFRTAQDSAPKSNGLVVKRNYTSTFGVGDIVDVVVRVENIPADSRYLVIEDELPSGLSPINKNFENERTEGYSDPYSYYYWGGNREYTQNGVIESFSYISGNTMEMKYQARVISRGKFSAPPAKASLMYKPEINGRSGVHTIKITGERSNKNIEVGDKMFAFSSKLNQNNRTVTLKLIPGIIGLLCLAIAYAIHRRKQKIETPTQTTF